MTEMVRIFWGLRCPPLPAVLELQDTLHSANTKRGAELTMVPGRNLHVTLRYVGAVKERDVQAVRDSVQPLIECYPTVRMVLRGVGRFSRALWVSVDAPPHLYKLARQIDDAMAESGLPEDAKPFRPHVTVARLGRGVTVPVSEWEEIHTDSVFGNVFVDTVHLYRSDIGPQGSRYTPVASFPLRRA